MHGQASVWAAVQGAAWRIRRPALDDEIHPLLDEVFRAFARGGVRWALLRDPTSLHRPTGDVDILVDPAHLAVARRLAMVAGFAQMAHRGPGSSLLSYHAPTESWIHIDLTTDIASANWSFSPSLVAGCLSRRSGEPPGLDPADRFWSLVLHLADDRRTLALRHRDQLAANASDAGLDTAIPAMLLRRAPEAAAALGALAHAVRVQDWPQVDVQLGRLRSMRARDGMARGLLRRALARYRDLGGAWPYRGVSVALLGPDGAGKSTLAAGLASRTFFPVRVVYMGTGSDGATTVRPRVLRRLRGPGLYFVGGITTQWVRYLSALGERLRGRVVVFDRYSEEALLPARASDPGWRRFTRRFRRALVCPPPELALVLDAPGEVMFQRKGEHTPAVLEEERRRYLTLSQHLPNVCVLNAQRTADELSREAVALIWTTYARRVGSPVSARSAWDGLRVRR